MKLQNIPQTPNALTLIDHVFVDHISLLHNLDSINGVRLSLFVGKVDLTENKLRKI